MGYKLMKQGRHLEAKRCFLDSMLLYVTRVGLYGVSRDEMPSPADQSKAAPLVDQVLHGGDMKTIPVFGYDDQGRVVSGGGGDGGGGGSGGHGGAGHGGDGLAAGEKRKFGGVNADNDGNDDEQQQQSGGANGAADRLVLGGDDDGNDAGRRRRGRRKDRPVPGSPEHQAQFPWRRAFNFSDPEVL